ncbi:hypothetical protein Rsub_03822 [Raphidocelis subcapitata]|uniref:Acid phosphatase n=1 Tax=Raphidocelis subcapitata TaxID=307507 RepID=A0A2V0P196_9CHLO|nr:hypothetical protein Rsub_03822 [Raphidocelis subcapitata]|eukprot:GBF90967.1 hypothetical protein Rsub_03822 [Raphidocelis subcapitata]
MRNPALFVAVLAGLLAAAAADEGASCAFSMGECLDALGGGNVTTKAGHFPKAAIPTCAPQMDTYIKSGAYLKAVETAARTAYGPLGLNDTAKAAAEPGRKTQMVVFDIDETLLSNVLQDPKLYASMGRRLAGAHEARDLVDFAAGGGGGIRGRFLMEGNAPALAPMLEVYKAVCAAGHPIALITGRSENARPATVANLEAAGYGKKCAEGTLSSAGKCCYNELILRAEGDNRLASIYKPGARGELAKKYGWSVYAAFGDQYSDFNGENPPAFGFKLPNPMYIIL